MPYRGPVHQWDVFRADLDYVVGSEQGGERPVIVVSNNGFNAAFPVVTVLPFTKTEGKRRKVYPFEVVIPPGAAGNPQESIIMPQQIRTIDKDRLLERMGQLEDVVIQGELEERILEHIGIDLEEEVDED